MIVMLVILALSVLAAGFAYSMRVETRLAYNYSRDQDMLWLARSGVEAVRSELAGEMYNPEHAGYDDLEEFVRVAEKCQELCNGLGADRVTIRITDLESKMNINMAPQEVLKKALVEVMGLDTQGAAELIDSIQDWKDSDDLPQMHGAESEFYLGLEKPYLAKNGPIDDLTELLLVKGMTKDLYWGAANPGLRRPDPFGLRNPGSSEVQSIGFVDLFNTLARPQINLNTASAAVLQLLPGVDQRLASEIVQIRTEVPLHSPGELINVRGMPPEQIGVMQGYCGVRSFMFETRIDVAFGEAHKTYVAVLFRGSGRDVQVLAAGWDVESGPTETNSSKN